MSAATRAPWSVESDPSCLNALVYGRGRKKGQRKQLVAQVWSGDDCSLDVAIANARLIAEAPRMLSLLKARMAPYNQIADSSLPGDWFRETRALVEAIEKGIESD